MNTLTRRSRTTRTSGSTSPAGAALPRARRGSAQAAAAATDDTAASGSAERSLRLLALVAAEGRSLTLAELSQRLGLPKATAHRLCTQLLGSGHLARDVDERRFGVGPVLRRLALDALNNGTVRGLRHEVLAALVAEVGETCNFTTLDGASVLYLDRVEAPWPWRLTMDVGTHVPLHCTASGKLFLAALPAHEQQTLLAQLPLPRMTANTLTRLPALRTELAAIAGQGYSTDREEFIPGLVALAVPVTDEQGVVRAALAVHGPVARLSVDDALARLPALTAAAARMSRLL
ncbi:IclR family transcriptional regulator [Pseudorhodoferax sp.]|uniref:IclR family transcriptional regulator n=1 Tax=Pseudorhodoferax sp. TaxID=1993553 RepID=UPI002DD63982|nr:IclR family transcriptional regulator [Pseudorhodoferax sp.]